jgi:hypothetical protein
MIRDALLWLLTSFVVEPAMAEVQGRLEAVQAPHALVQQVRACAATAPAALAEKASSDLLWAVRTIGGVALGATDATSVIAGATPGCAAAVTAIRPLLGRGIAS